MSPQPAPALTFPLPIPVGINGSGSSRGAYTIVHVNHKPRLVSSRAAVAWHKCAELETMIAARRQGWADPGGPLELTVARGDADGHDADSGIKLLMDAVADGLGIDDRRFWTLHIDRHVPGVPAGSVLVTIAQREG